MNEIYDWRGEDAMGMTVSVATLDFTSIAVTLLILPLIELRIPGEFFRISPI